MFANALRSHPSVRWAAGLLVLSLAFVGCKSSRVPQSDMLSDHQLKFGPAEGLERDRMLQSSRHLDECSDGFQDSFALGLYQAQWGDGDAKRFVRMTVNAGHLWGNQIDMRLFDSRGQMVNEGIVRVQFEHEFPYALVELKTASSKLPTSAREVDLGFGRREYRNSLRAVTS